MTDSQTLHDLTDACAQPGCPLCTVTRSAVERYVRGLFSECILDPLARRKLRDSLGLCREHASLAFEAGLSDALGWAIVYEDLVGKAVEALPAPAGGFGDARKEALRALAPARPCPACGVEEATTARFCKALAEALGRQAFHETLRASNGLCLPHLRCAIEHTSNRRSLGLLLEIQSEKLAGLRQELAEFVRKNDYRFRSEPFGAERDSYRRAIETIVGTRLHKPE